MRYIDDIVETINEYEKCTLCFAYFCHNYTNIPHKENICAKCKHEKECMTDEYEELKDFEKITI